MSLIHKFIKTIQILLIGYSQFIFSYLTFFFLFYRDQKQKLLSCNVLTNLVLIISLLEINLMMKLVEKYPFLQKEKECLALSL
jgi:hypothetical protein